MKNRFCKIIVSSTSRAELDQIVDVLLKEKLVACADTMPVRSRYWWKGKIVSEKRQLAILYSRLALRKRIIAVVRRHHSDECPGIVFTPIDANKDFLRWIQQSTAE